MTDTTNAPEVQPAPETAPVENPTPQPTDATASAAAPTPSSEAASGVTTAAPSATAPDPNVPASGGSVPPASAVTAAPVNKHAGAIAYLENAIVHLLGQLKAEGVIVEKGIANEVKALESFFDHNFQVLKSKL